ncbi:hypothetical protein TVAG_092120 [Trichomonas vaginalis G3]|uniref:Uncharacterized protein n=1 Tax=Trichomonas vaginalis (strain ATCC PRA-98 / G3) TaxID=412133 RepID=A2FWG9_TRIV3|nr:translation initiation factor eIF3 subunit family [Trichomonas vaginalis G3]EAX90739.1 hypothetical protein TVAG_092120 [Trichomonas vaginalis G3]KAI5515758.1 translation initiation factor eIF3 subunit family [Trichomonas vaginalis G3]|eukprot:XP_001303669.1 hypothetical protein [Trichomonas vaginalis G3]
MAAPIQKDFENFAYEFGEHCFKFNTHEYYKKFVDELIHDIAQDLTAPQLHEIQQIIDKATATRIKEEKAGDVEFLIHRKAKKLGSSDDDDSSDDNQADLYVDFM